MKRPPEVLAVIHLGNYKNNEIVDDNCPFCHWEPPEIPLPNPGSVPLDGLGPTDPVHLLGQMWMPGVERGIGAYFQIYHCQNCGAVYGTHLN